jgi:hypothetical protein
MEQKYLFLRHAMVMSFLFFMGLTLTYGQTLKHSYKFEDGTANDGTGTAHGTLMGDATVADGAVVLTGDGFVGLPGKDIEINTYTSVSIEALYKQAEGLEEDNTFTVLYSFGETNPSVNWMGIDYFLYQPTRKDGDMSRFSISCENTSNPWATETGVDGKEITDTSMHYVATIINGTEMKIYQDGALLGTATLSTDNKLANVSNDTAFLGASVYPNDAKWEGEIHEINIFEGELDEETIVKRAEELLKIPIAEASLSSITASRGPLSTAFDPEKKTYELYLDKGITEVTLEAVPTVKGATVKMTVSDVELEDGVVTWGLADDGVDVKITCTALNGTSTQEYWVSVFLNDEEESPLLTDIQLSAGSFTTDFDPDTTNYFGIIPYGTSSITVTGVPAYSGAAVSGNGTVTFDEDGLATTTITVTSSDESSTRDYTLQLGITKVTTGEFYYLVNEPSENLVLDGDHTGDAQPKLYVPIKDDASQLFEFVATGNENEYYIKNKVPSYLALDGTRDQIYYMTMLGDLTTDLDSCRFVLNEFEPGRFKIYSVTRTNSDTPERNMVASDNTNLNTWVYSDKWEGSKWDEDGTGTIIWNILPPDEVVDPYDTYLAELTIDEASLYPAYNLAAQTYYVTVPIDTTTLTVSAVANDPSAVNISGTGEYSVSDDPDTIKITVTAKDDNSYTREYLIIYKKDKPLNLTHSYTFADGTANDQVGTVHGKIEGNGSITKGLYTSAEDGDYISLSGEDLSLKDYPSLTLEAYVLTGDNPGWTYLGYFGGTDGAKSLRLSIAGGDDVSRVALNATHGTDEVTGTEPGAEENHHYVSVLSSDSLYFYTDGALVGKIETNAANAIRNISTDNAFIGKGGWSADPTWLGSIYEFNIYEGQMDAATVASRAYGFPLEDSTSDATLSDLALDGTTIDGFASHTLIYDVQLASSTTTPPTVTATTSYPEAEAVVTNATTIPGTATVNVTAEDATTVNVYKVNFFYEYSKEASLSDLTVDGTTIDGFDPTEISYTVVLDQSVTTVPTVAAVAKDEGADVAITDATEIPGTTTVVVTAEDGTTTMTYSILFKYDVSSDATLSDLKVDGTTVNGFDPSVITYVVNLAAGTTTVPTVTATSTNAGADVAITDAASVPGTTTINVTAEDEVTKKTYSISFTINTGISDVEGSKIQVYPTVFNNSFIVKTESGNYDVSVFDVTGKQLIQETNIMGEVEITVEKPGMYVVEVKSEGVVNTYKVFKME